MLSMLVVVVWKLQCALEAPWGPMGPGAGAGAHAHPWSAELKFWNRPLKKVMKKKVEI